MKTTTITLSVETRDRLRALDGDAYEATIIEALDALEADRFWTQAEAAAGWRSSRSVEEIRRLVAAEAEADAAFDGFD